MWRADFHNQTVRTLAARRNRRTVLARSLSLLAHSGSLGWDGPGSVDAAVA
jgi:hypothetical protein